MMHFKKNFLAEYTEQGSDERSSESSPSSPSSSSDDYEPGQEQRQNTLSKTSGSSQSRKRSSPSKQQQFPGASSRSRIVPGPSPGQARQLESSNNDESPRKRMRDRQVSPSESNYHSPQSCSQDLVIEYFEEDSQPQRSPGEQKSNNFESFHSSSSTHSSKSTSSSAYSLATPSATRLELSSSLTTTQQTRRRRRQDNLLPADCPLRRNEIVDLPIDEFNALIDRGNYTETQKAQFKEWRRKGKNRVAARKSREKRIIGIEQLKHIRDKKIRALKELDHDLAIVEKERLNLKFAVETFLRHFTPAT